MSAIYKCCASLGLLILTIAGCSRASAGVEKNLLTASGTVTLDGKPVKGALVTFTPTGTNTQSHQGSGVTDSDGNFEMFNYQNQQGLPPGEYVATFSIWLMPDGSAPPAGQPPATSRAVQAIPPLWTDVSKAGLHNKVTVSDSGNSDFLFQISKDATGGSASPRVFMR